MMRRVIPVLIVPLALVAGCSSGHSSAAPATTTTSTTGSPPPSTDAPERIVGRDLLAARRAFNYVDRAFSFHLVDGQQALAAADYYVWSGHERERACVAQWTQGSGGTTRVDLNGPSSWASAPQWQDPVVGRPQGRVYAARAHVTLTDTATGRRSRSVQPMHVTVLPNGEAKLFISCTDPMLTLR